MEWETVVSVKDTDVLQRLRVPGGWLYRTLILQEKTDQNWETTVALCFVPEGHGGSG